MKLDMREITKGWKYDLDEDIIVISQGGKAGSILKTHQIHARLDKYGVEESEYQELTDKVFEYLKNKELRASGQQETIDIVALCKESKAFDMFTIVKNISTNQEFVYVKKGNNLEPICKPGDFTAELFMKLDLDKSLGCVDLLINATKDLFPLRKNQILPNFLEIIKNIFGNLQINKVMEFSEISDDLHPVVVEGCDVPACITIPYTRQDVTIDDLNFKLKEFLLQVKHHEYLCAVLWGSLNGKRYPEACYLKGIGNDGKTGFINMLGKLFGGSIAEFIPTVSQFSMSSMYGKALLNASENSNPHFLSVDSLKKVTGGNTVKIENKGKDAFQGKIKGLVIVDSNTDLIVRGEDSEFRRLRYFKVDKPNIQEKDRLDLTEYTKIISSTPNEFLNYCRQCFETHSTEGGLVKENPDAREVFAQFMDSTERYTIEMFLKSESMVGFKFNQELVCNKGEVLFKLREKYPRDFKYLQISFLRYLQVKYNVRIEGEKLYGFGKEEPKISKVSSDIEEKI